MLAGTVVLLVLAIGVLAFVLYPLWVASRRSVSPSPFPPRLLDLLAERDAIFAALRDLQLDHETGKVAAGEYQALRLALLAEAARVLRATEEIERELELSIEQEIAQLRELARQGDPNASTAGVPT